MNIDIEIVARALDKAGQEPLTPTELEEKTSTRWRLVKDYYLSTILETLSNTAWTCLKVRKRLVESEQENLSEYSFMYELPADCAKTVALATEHEYIVEKNILYTNDEDAVLIYITNGYTGEVIEGDDYPLYADLNFDPNLSNCIETKLAAKMVMKLTGDINVYSMLLQEAMLMENTAVKASSAQGRNKAKGNRYWSEVLGLPDVEGI